MEALLRAISIFLFFVLFIVTSCEESKSGINNYMPDIKEGKWNSRARLTTARQELQPVLHENKIYLIGGFNSRLQVSSKVEIYDIESDTWSTGPNYPQLYHHIAAASANGKIYAFGGFSGQNFGSWVAQNEIYTYEANASSWEFIGRMPEKMAEHLAITFNNEIYILSGKDSLGNPQNRSYKYEPLTDSWTQLANMPTERTSAAVTTIGSEIFVVGGRIRQLNLSTNETELVNVKTNEAFNPITNTWKTYSGLPYSTSGLAAGNIGGELFIIGGESISGNQVVYGSVYKYNLDDDEWENLLSIPTSRHGTGGISYNNSIIVIGGADAPVFSATDANEIFTLE